MKSIKYLILLAPFNALAHPGHAELSNHAWLSSLTGFALVTALASAALVGTFFFVKYARQRKD